MHREREILAYLSRIYALFGVLVQAELVVAKIDKYQELKDGSVHLPLMSGPAASGLKSACSFIPRRSALNELGGNMFWKLENQRLNLG